MLLFSHWVTSDSFWPMECIACQLPLSMEFSRQEYWNGRHFFLQGIFPIQRPSRRGIEPVVLHWQADFLPLSLQGSPMLCVRLIKILYCEPVHDWVRKWALHGFKAGLVNAHVIEARQLLPMNEAGKCGRGRRDRDCGRWETKHNPPRAGHYCALALTMQECSQPHLISVLKRSWKSTGLFFPPSHEAS